MAVLTGNNGAVSINGISVLAVRNFSVEMTADTIETSVMKGGGARTYVSGLSQFSGSADVYFDPADFDTNETTFNPTAGLVGASGVAVKLFVELDATGTNVDKAFTGNVIVTGFTVSSAMDGMVEGSISFQGTGATAFATGNTVYP
jgi:hypothetical protein